jgi:hypothetical protein
MPLAYLLFVLFVVFIDCSNKELRELRKGFNDQVAAFHKRAECFELKNRSVIPKIPPIEEIETKKFEILHQTYQNLVKEIYSIYNRVHLLDNLKLFDQIVLTHLSPIARYYNDITNFKPSKRATRQGLEEIKCDRQFPAISCLVQLCKIPLVDDRLFSVRKSGFYPFSAEAFPVFQRILNNRFQSIKKGQKWSDDDFLRYIFSYANALSQFDPKSAILYKFVLKQQKYMSHHSSFPTEMISIFEQLEEFDPKIFIKNVLPFVGEIFRILKEDENIIRFKTFLEAGAHCSSIIYSHDYTCRMNFKILDKIYHIEYALLMVEREPIPLLIYEQIIRYINELVKMAPPIRELSQEWGEFNFSKVLFAYYGLIEACEKHVWGKREVLENIIKQVNLYSPLLEEQAALIYQQHVFLKWKLEEMREEFQAYLYATKKLKVKPEDLRQALANDQEIAKSKRYIKFMNLECGFNKFFTMKRDEDFETLATYWLRPIVLEKLQGLQNSKTKPSPRVSRKAEGPVDLVKEAIALVNEDFFLRTISTILRNPQQNSVIGRKICQIIVTYLNRYLAIDLMSYAF